MNLWIRSQDKRILQKIDNIFTNANYDDKRICTICDNDVVELGQYKSKERALEVLDEIHNAILGIISLEDIEEQGIKKYTGNAILSKQTNSIVYEMPKE